MREFAVPLVTGFAMFLFGMQVLRLGLAQFVGKRLETQLYQFTKTPLVSFLTGLLVTVIFQSSSVVTVLAIGLVNTRALRFSRCIGLILGTNAGSVITTEILIFPIEKFVTLFLLIGTVSWLLPWRPVRFAGLACGGLGCIFLGMLTMAGMVGMFHDHGFLGLLSAYDSLLWGVISGTVIAAVIQTSSATVALMMGLYDAHAISLLFGLGAVLGSNVGTCITAWAASIGGGRTGKQVAMAHLLVNAAGLAAFYPFMTSLSDWIAAMSLSPYAQIAHFQTGFNVVCSLAFLPFSSHIARIVGWLLPVKHEAP